MRPMHPALLLILAACAPFEGQRSAEAYGVPSSSDVEVAFPGAEITGEGEAELDLGDGNTVRVPFVVQEGMAVTGEDILLGAADDFMDRSAGMNVAGRRWPSCTVPYSIDSNLNGTSRSDFLGAIQHWEANTGLRFVEDNNAPARVRVVEGAGCSSFVGRLGNVQALTLNYRCGRGGAIHEIGHAVGLFHEQSRADRDSHVLVHWNRIPSDRVRNFQSYVQTGEAGVDLGPYDLGSIMHYESGAFRLAGTACHGGNTSGCTITHRNGAYLFEHQRIRLSSGDIAGVAQMYSDCNGAGGGAGGGGGGGVPDDHGNGFSTATVVNGPMQMQGHLEPGDNDVFAVNANSGDTVLVYSSGNTDTVGELYRDGAFLGSDGVSGNGGNFAFSYTASDSAFHVNVLGANSGTTGNYTLHIETDSVVIPGSDDHGDSIGEATLITNATSVDGTLTPGDEDFFRIEAPVGSTVTVGTAGSVDTFGVHLVNGIEVDSDDTTGPGFNFELSYEATSAQHVVMVRGWNSSSQGPYSLFVDIEGGGTQPPPPPPPPPPPNPNDDHGNDNASGTGVSMPTAGTTIYNGQLTSEDVDVFRVYIFAPATLSVSSTGSLDTYGLLYDGSGALLTENDDTVGQQFALSSPVSPGTYFLHVRGYDASTVGSYQVHLTTQ